MNVNISEAERKVYVKYFEQIDGDRDGVSGAREVIRLRETGVSDQVLGFIWANCVLPPAEGLSLDAFFLAMRIISLSQHLLPPDLSLARSSSSSSTTASTSSSTANTNNANTSFSSAFSAKTDIKPSVTPPSTWTVTPAQRATWRQAFEAADSDHDGLLTTNEARIVLEKSGLPVAQLGRIWSFADHDNSGTFNWVKFGVASALIVHVLCGKSLPAERPLALFELFRDSA